MPQPDTLSQQAKRLKTPPPGSTKEPQKDEQGRKAYQREIVCTECIDGYGVVSLGRNEAGAEIARQCATCQNKLIEEQRDKMQHVSVMTGDERLLRFGDVSIDGRPDTARMMQAVREFIESPFGMQTFYGTNGNGKSAALIVAVNECLDRGVSSVYIPAYDLLNWIQDAFNENNSTRDGSALERLDKLKTISVLAVDELQAVKMSDWRVEQLENLIDYRHRFGLDGELGTLFAMNEHPDDMQSFRIRSRMKHGGNATNPIIQNNDPDLRGELK